MALRERLRKTFSYKKKNGSDGSTPSGGTSGKRSDIEYYKPHEIPKSKYRGKVDPEHQERLESYSLGDAFASIRRRTSQALSGTFSPGGTQAQSRRASWVSRGRSSISTTRSRAGSDTDGAFRRRTSVAAAGAPQGSPLPENEVDDTDVANGTRSETAGLGSC